jgi:Caspase domain
MVRRLASLACALLFAAISLPVLAKEREALVIGNGQDRGLPSRPQSVADAAAVADMLRKIGFEVSESANLDRNGMRNALAQFRARLGDARIVVLFYSGGAVQAGGRSRTRARQCGTADPRGRDGGDRAAANTLGSQRRGGPADPRARRAEAIAHGFNACEASFEANILLALWPVPGSSTRRQLKGHERD